MYCWTFGVFFISKQLISWTYTHKMNGDYHINCKIFCYATALKAGIHTNVNKYSKLTSFPLTLEWQGSGIQLQPSWWFSRPLCYQCRRYSQISPSEGLWFLGCFHLQPSHSPLATKMIISKVRGKLSICF